MDDASEESERVKTIASPGNPTKQEVDEHMMCHVPFRSWCEFCVKGKAVSMPHHRISDDRRNGVPVISIDYAFMGSEDGASVTVLIMQDRASRYITANVVQEKGINEYAVKRLGADISMLGYKEIVLKSDQEPSIVALKDRVKADREERIVMEESPVGESASNGAVERAIQTVEGQVRTMKAALEFRLKKKVEPDHPLIPWLIRHAASTHSRYHKGMDGKTAYERLKGKSFTRQVMEFGVCVVSQSQVDWQEQNGNEMGGWSMDRHQR